MADENYQNGMQDAANAIGAANMGKTVSDYLQPQAIASRQEARVAKLNSDKALATAKATQLTPQDLKAQSDTQSLQIQDAANQAKIANMTNARMTTYFGFQQFEQDGNPEHFNNAFETLRQNPVGKNLFSDIQRMDKIGPGDEDLLKKLGVTYDDFQKNPKLNKMFLRATMSDGSVQLAPVEAIYAATGYNKYQTQQELQEAQKRASIFHLMQTKNLAGSSAAERVAHTMTKGEKPANIDDKTWVPGNPEYDAKYIENYQANKDHPEHQTQSEAEATRQTQLAKPSDSTNEEWDTGNPDYDKAYQENFVAIRKRETQTSGQKEQTQVSSTRDKINEMAQKDGKNFFDMDFTDRANRIKYEQPIQDMMRLGKMQLTPEDKRTATYIHELTSLGDSASNIGPEQTGIIDRLVRSVKNYVSDEPGGLDLTSAYSAFRNTIRHALFGSALTEGEITSFNEQFGNLKQQAGPVLAQFNTGLKQIKSQLESMMNLGDSYVTHFYLGADDQQLHRMIDAIDERIGMLNKISATASKPDVMVNPNGTAKPAVSAKPSLDDLYNNVYKNQPTGK